MNAADIYYRRTGRNGLYNITAIENLPSIMEYYPMKLRKKFLTFPLLYPIYRIDGTEKPYRMD